MQTSSKSTAGWADNPVIRQRIRYALYVICAALVLADFIVHRHIELGIEQVPAFYALYGFAALVGVVLLAKGLRRLVARPEDYYRKDDDHAA
ncbi:MAG: hypothetical protein WD601_13810 [Pseudohongiellaceae bacterium]